jgi:hypothetical protein
MAVLADECEPVSAFRVELSRSFSYLVAAFSLGTVEIGRFLCLEIVVSRDGSAVKPDGVVAKPDEVELFADKPGAKSIAMKALPGESCRLLGGDCRLPGRYCRFLGMRLNRSAGVALTGQAAAVLSDGRARATSLRRSSDPEVRSWWGLP